MTAKAPLGNKRPFRMIAGVSTLADLADGLTVGTLPIGIKNAYYVDPDYGNDGNDGSSWDSALKTYLAARTAANAKIDWAHNAYRYNAIVLAPGVYTGLTEAFPYYCYVIGTGVRGTDTATEFHPATGPCFTGTMLGTVLYNLWLETNQAVDVLDCGICNNSAVIGCTLTNGAAVAALGMTTENCTHLEFAYNDIETGQTTGMSYGLKFAGGSNKYAHNVRIHNNTIFADTDGIYIASTCTASQAMIYDNRIFAGGVGINDLSGTSYATGNYIAAPDAIVNANSTTHCVGNHVSNAGTGAKEVSNS